MSTLQQKVEELKASILNERYGTPYCVVCGVDCRTETARGKHEPQHTTARRSKFECSICGIRYDEAGYRNRHERKFHCFERPRAATSLRKAVRITRKQLKTVKNLGFKFLRVQCAEQTFDLSTPRDPRASEAEIVAQMLNRPKIPGVPLNCKICSLHFNNMTYRENHEKEHAPKRGGWRCCCCGIYERTQTRRAAHELSMHGFRRASRAETNRRGLAVVPEEEVAELTRVPSNFAELQEAARQRDESSDEEEEDESEMEDDEERQSSREEPPEEEQTEEETRASIGALLEADGERRDDRELEREAVKNEDDFEMLVEQQAQDVAVKEEPPVEERAAANRPSTPTAQPPLPVDERRSAFELPPSPTNERESPAAVARFTPVELMQRMLKENPTVLYYDHEEFGPTCKTFPLHRWLVHRRSTVLFVRSATPVWREEPERLNALLRWMVPVHPSGSLLCFAKDTALVLADRLVLQSAAGRSFPALVQLIAEETARDGLSAMIVCREEHRRLITQQPSVKFVVM